VKRSLVLVLILALLGGAVAHIVYWYLPRERAVALDRSSPLAGLLEDGSYGACVWIPFPHQNLGALAKAVGNWEEVVGAGARLAGARDTAEVRTFGPFAVPPSDEMVACTDRSGGRMRIAAHVYPGLGMLARFAGRLASNPWLSGGEVGKLRVSWEKGVWSVAGGAEGPPVSSAPDSSGAPPPPALAILRVGATFSELPAGTFRLTHRGDDFLLNRDDSPAASLPALPKPLPALVAFLDPGADGAAGAHGPTALALFPHSDSQWNGSFGRRQVRVELPGVAVLHPTGSSGWRLPGGTVSRLLSGAPLQATVDQWTVQALDRGALQQASALVPSLEAVRAEGHGFTIAVWADPNAALGVVSRVRQGLEAFPFTSRSQLRQWRDWESLIGAFRPCGQLALLSRRGEPEMFHLQLNGCRSHSS
jgi:hypothetical protein